MCSIKEVIESAGMPAERGVYTGEEKPPVYCTFLRLNKSAALRADDKEITGRELYRVTLFSKNNFETMLELLIAKLEAAGFYINSVDAEQYEIETGYWIVPVTIEILKEWNKMTLGLRDLYYALCEEKDGGEVYGTPKKLAEVMNADLSVKTATADLYADDAISESVKEFVNGTLKLGIKDLTPEVLAEVLGQMVDQNSVVWAGDGDEPPFLAIGFRAAKTGGRFRYIWLLKCKFELPGEKYETKGESIKFNTPEITATFYKRKKDGKWKADFVGKENEAVADTWFTEVPEPVEKMVEA